MTQNKEHFYAVQSFLEDDELHKIWNIIEIAMNREGYDVQNAELSMRLYDPELTETKGIIINPNQLTTIKVHNNEI